MDSPYLFAMLFAPQLVLIAKCVHRAHFITVADGELGSGLIIRIQMGILDSMLCFQAYPLNIVLFCHRMRSGTNTHMDCIPLNPVDRNMLFTGCFYAARIQLLHLLAAAVYRNTLIPDHGNNIAAVLTNQKFLLHFYPSL